MVDKVLLDLADKKEYIYYMSKRKFSVGDLVQISDGTHDARLPDNRTGLIISLVERRGEAICQILMTNGETLQFHGMFLKKVEKENEKV
tara:strand:- start:59 stop:325 length:267 start_codon:yes stop_codon:yes gene_type:complete